MSFTVRLTSILGFLVLNLAACGGSSPGNDCDTCATHESALPCGPSSGCDEPSDPPPTVKPFPPAGTVTSGPSTSTAQTDWGQACVEEIVSSNPFTTRWTYGAVACGTKWCPATCSATDNRIYLTFTGSFLTYVSPVSVAPPPETGPFTVSHSMRNGSSVSRACAMNATWHEGGAAKQTVVANGDSLAALAALTATGSVAKDASVTVVADCWAPGQPTVQRATKSVTFAAVRTCSVNASYFLGSDGVPVMEISETCIPDPTRYP